MDMGLGKIKSGSLAGMSQVLNCLVAVLLSTVLTCAR